MDEHCIIYEQPLNELIRVSLRLEYLFKRIDACLAASDIEQHTQELVGLLIDVLNLLDRPDLKSKFTKEFNRLIADFSHYHANPHISKETLDDILRQLKDLLQSLHNIQGKIAQTLRDNEFLANARQNMSSPGGDSCVDAPEFYYWLNQPTEIQLEHIQNWLNEFKIIRSAVGLLLDVVRKSAESYQLIAQEGFYCETLDAKTPCQLIQVAIPANAKLFPEISAGRHRMSIRFVIPSMTARPKQTSENVSFWLTKCAV